MRLQLHPSGLRPRDRGLHWRHWGIALGRNGVPVEAAFKDQVSIAFTVPAQAAVGSKVNLILNGAMTADKVSATRIAPAIPIKIVAGP